MWATLGASPLFAAKLTVTVASPVPEAGDRVKSALSEVAVQAALEEMLNDAEVSSALALMDAGDTLQYLASGSAGVISVATTLIYLPLPVIPLK